MRLFSAAALLALAAPAFAEDVVLRNGAVFSGIVTRENGRVVVKMDVGTMSFAAGEVAAIRGGDTPLRDLERRIEAASSAQDWHDAAVFAAAKGLASRVAELHGRAIEADPEHAGSRTALGFRRLDGRWLRGGDLMLALGFVRHGEAWVKPEEKARLEAATALAEAQEAAVDGVRESEARLAEERRALESARMDLEQERLALERKREEQRRRALRLQPPEVHVNGGPYADPYRNAYWHADVLPCLNRSCACRVTTTRGGPPLSVSR